MSTPTLQELRKAKFKTVKAFAEAAHLTEYQASNWLLCRWSDTDETPIMALLGVTREEYYAAREATDEYENKKWREKHPPRPQGEFDAELKAYCEERWTKMSESEKRRVHEQAVKMGLVQERRSPIDILIDRATGRE